MGTKRAWFIGIAAAVGCGLFPELSSLTPEGADDAASSDGANDTTLDALMDVGSGDAPFDAGADVQRDDAGCPTGQGPAMVRVDSFTCIDSTEVTVAQYRPFASVPAGGQIPECGWNGSFVPLNGVPGVNKNNFPIANTNWCQAYAFCAWAGKTLCGGTDGGALPYAAYATTQSSWMNACSANGTRTYPYGNGYLDGGCNLSGIDGGNVAVVAVESFPACVGGVPGLYDMVGNIKEWENSCLPASLGDAAADICRRRGAGVDDPTNSTQGTCAYDENDMRNHQSYTSGFRCCAYMP